jgi:biopolymer transport protein ExbB
LRKVRAENALSKAELVRLQREAGSSEQNGAYVRSLLRETLQGVQSALLPGEAAKTAEPLDALVEGLAADRQSDPAALGAASTFLTSRLQSRFGGSVVTGQAIDGASSRIVEGRFLLMGPESYFLPAEGGHGAIARLREGAPLPIVHPLKDWSASEGAKLVSGQTASLPLDASGGKALQLRQARGTLMDQIRAGGPVGHSIICLGTFGWILCILKLVSLRRRRVNEHASAEGILAKMRKGEFGEAKKLSGALNAITSGLFLTALEHAGRPRQVVEEHLQAYLLRQRLVLERWLPSLRVIAAAAPLLGLLGTVTGMIRTFTLITVFGTGNAARLSSGISEALVTTVEGLIVAIPTLVIYGYLSQQSQQALSQLDGFAVEISASMEESGK